MSARLPAGFDTAPLKERPVPRAQPGSVPRVQLPSRPIPILDVTKVESRRTAPGAAPIARPFAARPTSGEQFAFEAPPEPGSSDAQRTELVNDPVGPPPHRPTDSATKPDLVRPPIETMESQLELTPNVFAENLEAAIAAQEFTACGQGQLVDEEIPAGPRGAESPAEKPAAAVQTDEPPLPAEPAPVEMTEDPVQSTVRQSDSSSRPDPGRRKRASNRGKNALGPRKETSQPTRIERGARPIEADLAEFRSDAKTEKWPSAREILATHCNRPRPQTSPTQAGRRAEKDAPLWHEQPAQWSLPGWIAGPPAAAFVIAVGIASCIALVVVGGRVLLGLDHDRTIVGRRPHRPARASPRIGHRAQRFVDSLDCAASGALGDLHEPLRRRASNPHRRKSDRCSRALWQFRHSIRRPGWRWRSSNKQAMRGRFPHADWA